ncbi:MAG: endonuclease/exonuclease/phosphatase family protein [Eudoraea sp.]|nr:endonuclease/exonuclease/phosphatase family protein [Eudoraea sp.]
MFFPLHIFGLQDSATSTYYVRSVAFYNLENLFDTSNDSLIFDDDRTAEGKDRWSRIKYEKKINDLAKVLSLIGRDVRGTSPDIIGLCELENQGVLQDLLNHENLAAEDYGIIHYDSPDERGIDVALIYRKSSFIPFAHKSQRLLLQDSNGYRDYTRDLLIVGGMMDESELYLLVNHWPSRSGGESRSRPYRMEAARLNLRVKDSLQKKNPDSAFLLLGDFNDNPTDISLKTILKARGKRSDIDENGLYNPMEALYKKGIGSLGYRDQWHLFDQILVSQNLLTGNNRGYRLWKAGVFNPPFLITQEGRLKGYPYRTYTSGNYTGGFSDHFPVYLYLVKKAR